MEYEIDELTEAFWAIQDPVDRSSLLRNLS